MAYFNKNIRTKFVLPYCDDAAKYVIVEKIGEGTYGEVFKARDKNDSDKVVALKKILVRDLRGFPITALREVKVLKRLKHANVIKLIEVCQTQTILPNQHRFSFYLVLEFCDYDLEDLLLNIKLQIKMEDIKGLMKQLLNGLYYIHINKVIHRDLKPNNILVTKDGVLKIADFGLARQVSDTEYGQKQSHTNPVAALWYRPPEVLLGARHYGSSLDMWSVGCIMAQFWTRRPIMRGRSEQMQLIHISRLCGSISPEVWPGVQSLQWYNSMKLPPGHRRRVKPWIRQYIEDPHVWDLLDKLLVLDPSKRIDCHSALDHDFFWSDPMPSDLTRLMAEYKDIKSRPLTPSPHYSNFKPQPYRPHRGHKA